MESIRKQEVGLDIYRFPIGAENGQSALTFRTHMDLATPRGPGTHGLVAQYDLRPD